MMLLSSRTSIGVGDRVLSADGVEGRVVEVEVFTTTVLYFFRRSWRVALVEVENSGGNPWCPVGTQVLFGVDVLKRILPIRMHREEELEAVLSTLQKVRDLHNADGERWEGFPRANTLVKYCTGCGEAAPCTHIRILDGGTR